MYIYTVSADTKYLRYNANGNRDAKKIKNKKSIITGYKNSPWLKWSHSYN